jgi:hypothetical protein
MRTWSRLPPAAFIWIAILTGCGLVDSDPSRVNLANIEKQYSIDSAAWNVNSTASATLLNQTCNPASVPDSCQAAVATLSACKSATCTAVCNEETSRCQLSLRVELWRAVNLTSEVPSLFSTVSAEKDPSLDVILDDVIYEVSANALNVDTPPLQLYVAPSTVMGPGGDGALRIAEIPSVPAITDLPPRSINFMAGGKEVLRRRLADYQVPFNLIVAAELLVDNATPIPAGRLNAKLTFRGNAGF